MKSVGYPFVWPGDRRNILIGFDCSSHARAPECENQLADERIAVARDVISGKYGNEMTKTIVKCSDEEVYNPLKGAFMVWLKHFLPQRGMEKSHHFLSQRCVRRDASCNSFGYLSIWKIGLRLALK